MINIEVIDTEVTDTVDPGGLTILIEVITNQHRGN